MNLSELSEDKELLYWLQSGNTRAFTCIYNKYVDILFNYTAQRMKNNKVAEDIVQEVFLRIWEKRQGIKIETSLENYLYGACRNGILNYIRSQKIHQRYEHYYVKFKDENGVFYFDEDKDNKLERIIQEKIIELPPKCQQVLRMKEEYTNQEIAEYMNISLRTVENYLSQAYKHFRSFIDKSGTIFFIFLLL